MTESTGSVPVVLEIKLAILEKSLLLYMYLSNKIICCISKNNIYFELQKKCKNYAMVSEKFLGLDYFGGSKFCVYVCIYKHTPPPHTHTCVYIYIYVHTHTQRHIYTLCYILLKID